MLTPILSNLQRDLSDFVDWWSSINASYRGAGCLLIALALILEATRSSMEGERDRRFFVTGVAALSLLLYSAVLFSGGDPTIH